MYIKSIGHIGIAVVMSAIAGAAGAANEYQLDDGVEEERFGLSGSGGQSIVYLNRFVADSSLPSVTDIRVKFDGSALGNAVDVALWTDPNNDGDPTDAMVLSQLNGVATNADPDGFGTFNIPNVGLSAGDFFFVGFRINITNSNGSILPGLLDEDGTDAVPASPPMGESFIAASFTDPNDNFPDIVPLNSLSSGRLGLNAIATVNGGIDGNWLIRANAIPTPGTIGLLGLAVVGAGRRRR